MTFPRRCWLITLSLTGILLTYGCAAARYMGRAERAARAGDWDRALQYCFEALRRDPDNLKYQATCRRMRLAAAEMHFQRAEALVEKNPDDIPTLEQAVLEYQLAVQSDPTHQLAAARLESTILKLQRLKEQRAEAAMEIERAKEKIARAAVLPKILHSEELIDVKYVDTSLRQILDSMAKGFGVNVIYDKDFQDTRYSVELRGVTFQEALQQILAANGLFYKVVSENTIMVIPDNPQKRRQHEELVVRTFYLSNADLNETMNLLRVIAGIQQIVPNTQLNAITVKDTPEKVALAERIIRLNDKAQAELILDVEILEVSRQTAARYGIDIVPEIAVTQTLDIGQGPGVIFGHQFRAIDAAAWAFTFPSIVYRALITDASTRVLARPQIRAADGKSMSVRLGNRVPIPTTTFTGITPTQPGQPPPAGGVIVPITSFQLVDIGINLDVKPRIHHNREVTLDLKFELTSIAAPGRQINEPPTLGSRVVNTTIRLKDGETNLLAGLLRQDERRALRGFPGIQNLPLLRDLFAANERSIEQTDVVFTITPHIIRMPTITEEDLKPLWVGTADQPRLREPPAYTVFQPPPEAKPPEPPPEKPPPPPTPSEKPPGPPSASAPAQPVSAVGFLWSSQVPEPGRVQLRMGVTGMPEDRPVEVIVEATPAAGSVTAEPPPGGGAPDLMDWRWSAQDQRVSVQFRVRPGVPKNQPLPIGQVEWRMSPDVTSMHIRVRIVEVGRPVEPLLEKEYTVSIPKAPESRP
jgi:general secretion pathway protein D